MSRNSIDVLTQLENLEVDAGLTYVDNEPLGRVRFMPLYHERYHLLISAESPFGNRKDVSWAEVGWVPLCLLTPDMQNRRIIDHRLRRDGMEPAPTLQSNSMVVLFSHVRTGRWASVMPALLAETMGLGDPIRSVPIRDDDPPTIGLVYPQREPLTPLTAALVTEAHRLGQVWGQSRR
jgi:DNA-binding transcriptional LysR family regulator